MRNTCAKNMRQNEQQCKVQTRSEHVPDIHLGEQVPENAVVTSLMHLGWISKFLILICSRVVALAFRGFGILEGLG